LLVGAGGAGERLGAGAPPDQDDEREAHGAAASGLEGGGEGQTQRDVPLEESWLHEIIVKAWIHPNDTGPDCSWANDGYSIYTNDHDDHLITDSWGECCSACQASTTCDLWTWFAENAAAGLPKTCNLKHLVFNETTGKSQCPRVLKTQGAYSGIPANFKEKGQGDSNKEMAQRCFKGKKGNTTTTATTTTAAVIVVPAIGRAAPAPAPPDPWAWIPYGGRLWAAIIGAALLSLCVFLAIICWMREEDPEPEPHHVHVAEEKSPPPPPPAVPHFYAKGYVDGMVNYVQNAPPMATVEITGIDSNGDGIPDVLHQQRLAGANLHIEPAVHLPGVPPPPYLGSSLGTTMLSPGYNAHMGTTVLQPGGAVGTTMLQSGAPAVSAFQPAGQVSTTVLQPGAATPMLPAPSQLQRTGTYANPGSPSTAAPYSPGSFSPYAGGSPQSRSI